MGGTKERVNKKPPKGSFLHGMLFAMSMDTFKLAERDTAIEKREGFEWPKFSPEAAALLAVLAGATGAEASDRKGIVTQGLNTLHQQVEKRSGSDPFARLLGQVLQEVKKQGLTEQADETIQRGIPIAIDEIRARMQEMSKGVEAEYRRRGLDKR
jgi:hypothetical protein